MARIERQHVAPLSTGIGLFGVLGDIGPNWVVDGWFDDGVPWWLPEIGTTGETVAVFLTVTSLVAALVTLALGIWLGVVAGRRIDVPEDYRWLARAVLAGTTFGVASAWIVLVASSTGIAASSGPGIVLTLGSLGLSFVAIPLPVTLGALAGAAVVHFESEDRSRSRYAPVESDDSEPSGDRDGHSRLES